MQAAAEKHAGEDDGEQPAQPEPPPVDAGLCRAGIALRFYSEVTGGPEVRLKRGATPQHQHQAKADHAEAEQAGQEAWGGDRLDALALQPIHGPGGVEDDCAEQDPDEAADTVGRKPPAIWAGIGSVGVRAGFTHRHRSPYLGRGRRFPATASSPAGRWRKFAARREGLSRRAGRPQGRGMPTVDGSTLALPPSKSSHALRVTAGLTRSCASSP